MPDFRAPFYSREDLRDEAESFLAETHPSRSIPVPIELMVEGLGIDIVPVPDLQASYDVVAYTTSDLKEIHVDQYVYQHRPGRYRFSLAHEVGHIRLHGDLFQSVKFSSGEAWKAFIGSISDKDFGYLEYQANEFAGQVLMPTQEMLRDVEFCKETILEHMPDAREDRDAFRDFIGACLAKRFEVSHQTATIRMDRENVPIP